MKKEFLAYLSIIGAPETLITKANKIVEFYTNTLKVAVNDIFVSEYIKQDGTREYENLWLLNNQVVMEAKQFLLKDDFDMMSIAKIITYWKLEKTEYDFQKATDASRCTLEITIEHMGRGFFKASKENCDYLKNILITYILPNLSKS